MKRRNFISAVAMAVVLAMTMSSCLGSFELTSRMKKWNERVGDKFVNELVFIGLCIVPVYEVCAVADLLVLNSIEFWSGESPLQESAENVIKGSDGTLYTVVSDSCGYTITSRADDSVVRLDYDAATQEWSYRVNNADRVVFLTYVDDAHVRVPDIDGTTRTVELSAQGVMAYRSAVGALPLMANY